MERKAKFLKFGALFNISAILKQIGEEVLLPKEIVLADYPVLEKCSQKWRVFEFAGLKSLCEDIGRE